MRAKRLGLVLLLAGLTLLLAGCTTTHIYNAQIGDIPARLTTCSDGTYTLAALRVEDRGDYDLVTKYSVSGHYDGAYENSPITLHYTTRYVIVTYEAKGREESLRRAAAEAFNEAKPVASWKTAEPLTSKETGMQEETGYRLFYNDDSRTFAYAYTCDTPVTASVELTGDSFAIDPGFWLEREGDAQ